MANSSNIKINLKSAGKLCKGFKMPEMPKDIDAFLNQRNDVQEVRLIYGLTSSKIEVVYKPEMLASAGSLSTKIGDTTETKDLNSYLRLVEIYAARAVHRERFNVYKERILNRGIRIELDKFVKSFEGEDYNVDNLLNSVEYFPFKKYINFSNTEFRNEFGLYLKLGLENHGVDSEPEVPKDLQKAIDSARALWREKFKPKLSSASTHLRCFTNDGKISDAYQSKDLFKRNLFKLTDAKGSSTNAEEEKEDNACSVSAKSSTLQCSPSEEDTVESISRDEQPTASSDSKDVQEEDFSRKLRSDKSYRGQSEQAGVPTRETKPENRGAQASAATNDQSRIGAAAFKRFIDFKKFEALSLAAAKIQTPPQPSQKRGGGGGRGGNGSRGGRNNDRSSKGQRK